MRGVKRVGAFQHSWRIFTLVVFGNASSRCYCLSFPNEAGETGSISKVMALETLNVVQWSAGFTLEDSTEDGRRRRCSSMLRGRSPYFGRKSFGWNLRSPSRQ